MSFSPAPTGSPHGRTCLQQINSDLLHIVKRDAAAMCCPARSSSMGAPVSVIVKRPRRKSPMRYVMDLPRRSRARRTWIKTWKMLVRGIPCEWPMC
jgi:hypothetical protein